MTKVLAVVSYTGGLEFEALTKAMLRSLWDTTPSFVDLKVSGAAYGSEIILCRSGLVTWETKVETESSLALSYNSAIQAGSVFNPDYVLMMHNDMICMNDDWMLQLMFESGQDHVTVAVNDGSLTYAYKQAQDKEPIRIQTIAAHIWLVPFHWCRFLKQIYGFWLFDESFHPCYGEDDWTAYLLSKQFGKNIFKLVPRSWVRHYKAQTAKLLGLDNKENRLAGLRMLKEKMVNELEDDNLREDLRSWVEQFCPEKKTAAA